MLRNKLECSTLPYIFDDTTLSITTLSIMTLSIMTLSITTLSIKELRVTLSIKDIQYNNTLPFY
jgi:hypothetical protein